MDLQTQQAWDEFFVKYGFERTSFYIRIFFHDAGEKRYNSFLLDLRQVSKVWIEELNCIGPDENTYPGYRVKVNSSSGVSCWTGCFENADSLSSIATAFLAFRDHFLDISPSGPYTLDTVFYEYETPKVLWVPLPETPDAP